MRLDERKITFAATAFAIVGILLLLLMSETAENASVAQALVAPENTLVIVSGNVANVTAGKFMLCDTVHTRAASEETGEPRLTWMCVSVKPGGLPSAVLLSNGRSAVVTGRVKEYKGNRYIEAEKIDLT